MRVVCFLAFLSIGSSQYCYSFDSLSPHCPNAFINGTIEMILNGDSTSVDHLQQQVESAITPYFQLNPGHWLISVSSFSDFSFCAPTIVRSLLTSCVIINSKKEIIVVVMKLVMRSCRRSLTQYFDRQQELRRTDMACASVASSASSASCAGYGWSSSGYVTSSSLSDDDLVMLNGEGMRDSLYSTTNGQRMSEDRREREEQSPHPATCPHCKFIYDKPVTLGCGHSLCEECCTQLLSHVENTSIPRTRPRMGISSYSRTSLNKTMTSSWSNLNGPMFSLWKSPRCIVCGEGPKKTPPVPNISLRDFLTTVRLPPSLRQVYEKEKKDNREMREMTNWNGSVCVSTDSSLPSLTPIPPTPVTPVSLSLSLSLPLSTPYQSSQVSIRDCLISIIGSRGVGKSCLLQTQLCNDMLIDQLLGKEGRDVIEGIEEGINENMLPNSPCSDVYSLMEEETGRRGVTYMLKLMEWSDVCEKVSLSMGVVIAYSIVDRDSFHNAHRLLSIFTEQRGTEMPFVLVGTKCDLEKRRQVQSYEGQMLAKQFNCPFIEVSARRNECVNESFIELVRVMESRNVLK